MKTTSFPREMQRHAKKVGVPLVRVQWDARHCDDDGTGVETVGPAPQWVVEALRRVVTEWRNAEERGGVVH